MQVCDPSHLEFSQMGKSSACLGCMWGCGIRTCKQMFQNCITCHACMLCTDMLPPLLLSVPPSFTTHEQVAIPCADSRDISSCYPELLSMVLRQNMTCFRGNFTSCLFWVKDFCILIFCLKWRVIEWCGQIQQLPKTESPLESRSRQNSIIFFLGHGR